MHLFVKLWKPKKKWLELNLEDRKNYIAKAQQGMIQVSEMGLQTIAWFQIDALDLDFSTGYAYCSVYKTQNEDHVAEFHKAMKEFEWYDYFDQVNATGQGQGPGAILEQLLRLPQEKAET